MGQMKQFMCDDSILDRKWPKFCLIMDLLWIFGSQIQMISSASFHKAMCARWRGECEPAVHVDHYTAALRHVEGIWIHWKSFWTSNVWRLPWYISERCWLSTCEGQKKFASYYKEAWLTVLSNLMECLVISDTSDTYCLDWFINITSYKYLVMALINQISIQWFGGGGNPKNLW